MAAAVAYLYFTQSTSTLGGELTDFAYRDTAALHQITLKDENGDLVTLRRTADGWSLNDSLKARPDAIKTLLSTMAKISVKAPVNEKAMNTALKIIIGSHTLVEAYDADGQLVKSYFIGGPDQSHTGTFALMSGSERPFVVHLEGFHGFLSPRYFTNWREWQHRELIALRTDEIKAVRVERFGERAGGLTLSKNESGWEVSPLTDDRVLAFDTVLLSAYLQRFAMVHFESYEETKTEAYLDSVTQSPPFFTLTVESNSGEQIALRGFTKPHKGMDMEGREIDYDVDRLYVQHGNQCYVGQYAIFNPLLYPESILARGR